MHSGTIAAALFGIQSGTVNIVLAAACVVLIGALILALCTLLLPKFGKGLKGIAKTLRRFFAWIFWVVFVASLLVLAVLVALDKVDPNAAAVAAGIAIATGALLTLGASGVGRLMGRVGKASIGPFALEFVSEAREAAGEMLYAEPDSAFEDDRSVPEGVLSLRLRLEAKLAFIAKHLLTEDGDQARHATYVSIGSLYYDGMLTEKEAHTATRVLTLREEELDALDPRVKRAFLVSATKVVNNIRASVHYGRVKKKLEDDKWTVLELPRGDARPDLWAEKGDRRFRVVPRFATRKDSPNLKAQIKRLSKASAMVPRVSRRVIVIPDRSHKDNVTPADADPRVVKFSKLPGALGDLAACESPPPSG